MTWSVGLAVVGVVVVAAVAWLLARPRGQVGPAVEGFAPQFRGYRMDQVDTVLDALEARVHEHDAAIAAPAR